MNSTDHAATQYCRNAPTPRHLRAARAAAILRGVARSTGFARWRCSCARWFSSWHGRALGAPLTLRSYHFFLSRIALGRKYWRWSFTLVVFVFPREEGFESERAGSGRKLVRVRNARFEIWLLLAKPGRAGGRASGALSSTAEMGRVVSSAVRVVRKRTTIGGAGRQFPPRARADVTPSPVASVSSLARFLRIPKALAARGH